MNDVRKEFEEWVRSAFSTTGGAFSTNNNGEYTWYVYNKSPGDINAKYVWVQGLWMAYQQGKKCANG